MNGEEAATAYADGQVSVMAGGRIEVAVKLTRVFSGNESMAVFRRIAKRDTIESVSRLFADPEFHALCAKFDVRMKFLGLSPEVTAVFQEPSR